MKIRKILSFILVAAILINTVFLYSNKVDASTTIYSGYVKDVNISYSKGTLKVTYNVISNPPTPVYIGYEDSTRTLMKEVSVGTKGKHTVSWKVKAPVFRVYTKLIARNYTDKDIIKTLSTISTKITYHVVTKEEDRKNKIGITIASGIITIAGIATGSTKCAMTLSLLGYSFGTMTTFTYNPTAGEYVVTKTSYNRSKSILTATVKVYKSKADYNAGSKPTHSWSSNKYIGF